MQRTPLHQPALPPNTLALVRRAAQFVTPFAPRLAGITLLGLTVAALGVAQPLAMKAVFDELGSHGATRAFAYAVGALLLLELTRAVFGSWLSIVTWNVRLGVDYAVRERLIGKLYALPMSYHQGECVGGITNRVNQGITGFVTAFAEVAFNVIPAVAYLMMSVVALTRMDWRLAVVVLTFTPVPALLGAWASKEQTRRERRLLSQWTTLYSRFNEVLAGIRTVKIFAMEEVERRRFLSGQRAGTDVVRGGVRRDTVTSALRDLSATLSRLAAIAIGGALVARGEITVGTLIAVLGYIGGLFGPVQGLTNIYQTLRKGTVSLESIFQILDTPDPVEDLPGAVEVQTVRGEVCFENVAFSYEGGQPVLSGVSLQVTPGETVAIVGASGSGKTTLMALLQRLYPLSGGRILVDGVDIRTMTQQSLRRNLGVVNQDVNLFNDTVRDNIAYARPTADDDEIEAAARAAEAHDFILALPEGYDTVVGEHGSRLSGGQRQRIGIARALLKDAPILILDEATSALDAASEAAIQDALRTLTTGRTTFIIAHRLSTVVTADRIVVMKDGAITAVGTHAELMQAGGYYASLVRRQAGSLTLVTAA